MSRRLSQLKYAEQLDMQDSMYVVQSSVDKQTTIQAIADYVMPKLNEDDAFWSALNKKIRQND